MFTTAFSEWTWQNIFVRIVLSLIVGIIIGIDRGAKRRGGGAPNYDYSVPWRHYGYADGAVFGSALSRAA